MPKPLEEAFELQLVASLPGSRLQKLHNSKYFSAELLVRLARNYGEGGGGGSRSRRSNVIEYLAYSLFLHFNHVYIGIPSMGLCMFVGT